MLGAPSTVLLLTMSLASAPPATVEQVVPTNRQWDIAELAPDAGTMRERLLHAGKLLGKWGMWLGGVYVNGKALQRMAKTPKREPILRVVRETVRRPVDLPDFMRFLDDVLFAGENGLRGREVYLTSSRLRKSGIFIHPDDVFKDKPRHYPHGYEVINVNRPDVPSALKPAADGDPVGPRWSARFPNPSGQKAKLAALAKHSPSKTFHRRLGKLIKQLKKQGADVYLESTYRFRERGYLMWGAFILSRAVDEVELSARIIELNELNAAWGLNIPIAWTHPDGVVATIEAARQMADAYSVVFATKSGARNSHHYTGVAADLTVVGLPRKVKLVSADGKVKKTFDLSAPKQTRDLSLSPELIRWVEKHYKVEKFRSDYPHWNDAAKPTN